MIASTASFSAFPGDAAYVASKGAVLALTKAMGSRWRRIRDSR